MFRATCLAILLRHKVAWKIAKKNSKGGQWLWHNQQYRYFREFVKRQRHLHLLQKRQRHLQPLGQRHRSWERRNKATRLPPLGRPHYRCDYVKTDISHAAMICYLWWAKNASDGYLGWRFKFYYKLLILSILLWALNLKTLVLLVELVGQQICYFAVLSFLQSVWFSQLPPSGGSLINVL